MDPYERKLRDMDQYLPFLEERISTLKKLKLKNNFPDPERERRLVQFQGMYRVLTTKERKTTIPTLEKFEEIIKKIQKQDLLDKRAKKDNTGPDSNYSDPYRPSSSCSTASSGSGGGGYNRKKPFESSPASPPIGSTSNRKKVFDDCPASPSPPRSPAPHPSSAKTAPIIIPTERRSRFAPPGSPPPPPNISPTSRRRFLFNKSLSPPKELSRTVPITRVDINQLEPQEWDTDDEDSSPQTRPEIDLSNSDVISAAKKLGDSFAKKEEIPIGIPKRDHELPQHPSDNIPTVQVNALGGSRRLKSVIENTNLLNTDINRLLNHMPSSPLTNVPEDGLHSPDPEILHHNRPYSPPNPHQRREKVPSTPSLLLNAPPTNSGMPILLDDIAEFLDDSDFRRQGKPSNRPISRMANPTLSPIIVSPRSDANPDPRVPADPRSRATAPINDPRIHIPVDPRTHGPIPPTDPRSYTSMPPSDHRGHGPMPPKDPRNLGVNVPRYADNYERHKRPMAREDPSMTPTDFPRPRHMDQFGPDPMGSPNMHGPPMPNSGIPESDDASGTASGFNPMNQMGPMNYDYRMGPAGMQPQQQWNGPPLPHMQPGPPQQVPGPYQMGPTQGPAWPNPGMHHDMSGGHPMMNGDSRMPPTTYPNQMGRTNAPHIQPLMSTNVSYGVPTQNRHPGYGDSRPYDGSYDQQQQQQQPPNDYQRGRPNWAAGGNPNDRFSQRPNTPFNRMHNAWNKDTQSQRPNRDPRDPRDPRVASMKDRDPRMRPEPHRPNSPPFSAKEAPIKGPPPGKEVHPNKLARQAAEKEAAAKKKPELSKEKDKDRDRSKEKSKEKPRIKSNEVMKSPLTDLYGVIDAKKALQKPGLQKFKIPKKRPSADTQPEPPSVSTVSEENWGDEDLITPSSTSHESANTKQSENVKKSSKSTGKEKDKSVEKDKENSAADKTDLFKQLAANYNLSLDDEDVSTVLKQLMKLSKKKTKKKTISDSDEDEDSDEERAVASQKLLKKKRQSKAMILFSSSEDSSSNDETIISSKKEKRKTDAKNNEDKEETAEIKGKKKEKKKEIEKDKEAKKTKETEKMDNKKEKKIEISIPEKRSPRKAKKVAADELTTPVKDLEVPTEESLPAEKGVETPDAVLDGQPAEAPAKAKPKRRFRELDALQEDLKSSWICDGAMKATGSRTCSQKNKPTEQEIAADEAGPAGKGKKVKGKPGPKPKKAPLAPTISSESEEDDLPLSRRSEGINDSFGSSAKSRKDGISKAATNKKARAKSVPKIPPPLFDESSNDSFNLDPSAVEPSSDISLHPESTEKKSAKGKSQKKGGKKTNATADPGTIDDKDESLAESSSDESFISNASSLLSTSAKNRDNNEEILENVMAALSVNSKYSAVKKKQTKKKKSNWQMGKNSAGILSKKKKKKAVTGKAVDDTINDAMADISVNDETASEHNSSTSTKKADTSMERTESFHEDEEAWKSAQVEANDEDLIMRVDPDALIGYTLSGQEKFQCLLCPFYRKNIVHHYKMQHPKKEVLISRLSVVDANIAIEEAKQLDLESNAAPAGEKRMTKFTCRFCPFMTKGIDNVARESFYEHCTNHTGEYRFSCLSCDYEAVAKGSIRTHYYKECRKHSSAKNLNDAIVEYSIPDEDRIHGYLCSKCNFVQMRRSNVEKHVKLWHNKQGQEEVKIIKIDMSLGVKVEMFEADVKNLVDPQIPQKVELKEEHETLVLEQVDVKVKSDVVDTSNTEPAETVVEDPDLQVTMELIEHKPEKLEKGNNLSAFVCPEELTNKEMEIQNERKKKMQEVAEDIGIKLDKEETPKRISIIDQLKDKIGTASPEEEGEPVISEKVELKLNDSTMSIDDPEDAVDPLQLPEQTTENVEETPTITEPVLIKEDPDLNSSEDKEDKVTAKLKDPLSFVNDPSKRTDSENDEVTEFNPPPAQYESDSSPEQSDHEISADVSRILKSTEDSSAKGAMMTTIQRLAAQLQNTKPLDNNALPEPETILADMSNEQIASKIKKEKSSPGRSHDDMAVLTRTPVKSEIKNEPASPEKNEQEEPKAMEEEKESTSSSTKSFIRIRRISGDKLSKGGDQECASANSSSMATIEPIGPRAKDDAGFLKIANVVSLAPKDNDNQVAPNLRVVPEASPQKVKGLSLLKKPSSYILKRVDGNSVVATSGETVKIIPLNLPAASRAGAKADNYISIGGQQTVAIKIDSKGVAVPITVAAGGVAPTTIVSSTNPSFKLVKIASPEQVSVAIKLKSANVYEKMLKDDKLMHLYKCMGRDCCFTTSNEPAFHKHLRLHEEDITNKIGNEPKDYFKCAYCYIDCKNYEDLSSHLKQMHIFCRYCCKYCFYRAFAHSYVEIHQKIYHQMKKTHILVVNEELVSLPPPAKRLDRKQIIKPYVCVHECNKYFFIPEAFILHLNMHHLNIVNGYECHVCQGNVNSVVNLIEHYKQHGYFKYHCMYCPHGSPSIRELHSHLSTAHYNQPPHILERCLPREIAKNLSAIDQLRIRDVDAIYRQRKVSPEVELSPANTTKVPIPSLIKSTGNAVSLLPTSHSMTTKIISSKENNQFVPVTTLDGGVSNIRILDARSLSSNATTSLLNLGKNIKVTVKETPKINSNEAVQESESEFVSTNLLDHTDFLGKKVKKETDSKSVEPNTVEVDNDSDIEIIEDYTTASSDTKDKDEKSPFKDADKPDSQKEDEQDENIDESTKEDTSGTEQPPTPSTPTSSPAASKSSFDSPNPSSRFLTLEDVKNTGFAGHELYICGYESCNQSAETADELRAHMHQCIPNNEEGCKSALYCVHCGTSSKKFEKPSFLIDHLKRHGLKRFSCAACNAKFALQSQATLHIRSKHKCLNTKVLPADPMNPSPEGLFFVHPVGAAEKLKGKKNANRSPEKAVPQVAEIEKTTFSPDETDSLPLQAIYNKAVQCAICPYSNKVRSNMFRHLQAHLKDESVPESSPVNPVPCLDKKERMFDKMVNLASSSHENGRMGGGGGPSAHKEHKSEEEESLPKYVPENKRYVCGVPECNYLTVEEAMLRHHLKALHSDEVYFRCLHCPPTSGQDVAQNIALEKMGVHLKMHDCRLYKCSHCIYHHYHRHVVERHLADKHPEKRQFVKVIRELQTDEPQPQQQQQPAEPEELELPDPDGNTWKCNLCDFKCVLKGAIQTHALNEHNEKSQFKCNGCSYKAISWVTFNQHMETKHLGETNVNFTTIYQRIKGLKKPEPSEPITPQDEPFDTTPLWRRDMPRIRHIRGILLEEEEECSETPVKSGSKRKLEGEAGKSAKVKSAKIDESKRARLSFDEPEKIKVPEGGFGPYGTPVGDQYVCTVCSQFKSKYKHDFRDHLYRDLKYLRWYCSGCNYKAVNRGAIIKHINSKHANESAEALPYSPNTQIEEWVNMVIKTQMDIMKNVKPETSKCTAVSNLEDEEEVAGSDDDDLVIDIKEEEENEVSEEEKDTTEVLPAPLICKHCHMTFIKWRGFKRHVQLKHLQRLRFLCPYCDRSSNSEPVMLQHVRSKHRELPEKVIENQNPQMAELTAEFWEHEYGLTVPKRVKKRKRRDSGDDTAVKVEHEIPCDKCDFMAMTVAGLKSHLRTHETRIRQKCNYCTFFSFNPLEMRHHWDVNHSHAEFKIEEAIISSAAMDANSRTSKKAKVEDERKTTVYYCYYCSQVVSTSLDEIRNHYKEQHADSSQTVVFKYKEHVELKAKCSYCGELGSKSTLVGHIRKKHVDKPLLVVERDEDGWMCKWCKEEFFTTKEEMDYHQRLFHSHLSSSNFKLVRRVFVCKQCQFDTLSLDVMQKHAKSHVCAYRCKLCFEKFKNFSEVKTHFKDAHPDMEAETRSITIEDMSKDIDVLVAQSMTFSETQLSPMKIPPSPQIKSPPTSPRVAKKSTTRQIVKPMRPFPKIMKAVARKSTNPLPRYPSGVVFETEQEPEPTYVSYYGRSPSPVDLDKLNTTIEYAGMKVKINCANLVKQGNLNIEPVLRLTDFRKEIVKGQR